MQTVIANLPSWLVASSLVAALAAVVAVSRRRRAHLTEERQGQDWRRRYIAVLCHGAPDDDAVWVIPRPRVTYQVVRSDGELLVELDDEEKARKVRDEVSKEIRRQREPTPTAH